MTGTAMTVVDRQTGEIVGQPVFSLTDYLKGLGGTHLQQQQALASAYDHACAALIGPNDVQQDGGRTFKKKSAWRKLARHFSISTEVVRVEREYVGDVFVSQVTVRALAPWGQHAEAVGACASDEATGRRVITIADAIATAETRATNRAVSNLIAMGEVSAEEMAKGEHRPAAAPRPAQAATNGAPVMPFGKSKGTPLAQLDEKDLRGALDWAKSKGKFEEFQVDAQAELVRRAGSRPQSLNEFPEALDDSEENLPF